MRILHIDAGREMRGGQRQVLYLLEGLAAAGHEQALLARAGSPLFEAAAAKGFDVRPVAWRAAAKIAKSADIVHAHDSRAHSVAAVVAPERAVVARRVAFAIGRGPLSRWKYSRARRFIAVSAHVRDGLIEAGIETPRISVVYDGVPPLPAAVGGTRILAPATDDPMKGTAILNEAARAGGFEVHYSTNLARDLMQARVFVYITREEGLGSAALLAMSAGVPVVASRVGGLPEIVEHGQTGLLTGNTPAEIADAVRRVLDDAALARGIAAAARCRAHADFSVDAMARGTLRVYERVLAC